ncbi:unnamed protein product [Strongylus vulgaris]|uniref:Uncharacterized protein n=1 Tax=Strongylus vulgaris TaxID=40348 RepID=A0A3P7IQL9_STRVU|nr:unnamed protein product [Strongylus vulgaris]
MNLREFLSNTAVLPKILPEEALAHGKLQKILGLQWDAERDLITIKCRIPKEENVTKRLVARHIASVYDPLGWLIPLMVKMKVFQQDLWKYGLQWDEKLPDSLKERWNSLREEVDGFQKFLPRMAASDAKEFRLAVFAGASDEGMAACVYLLNEQSTRLIMAKSRLPSIKVRTTIPKMELNAITIAARLILAVFKAVRTDTSPRKIHILSDSQVALSWVSLDPQQTKLGVLVRNRIKEIQEIVNTLKECGVVVYFHYVTSEDNPADAGTRGLNATTALIVYKTAFNDHGATTFLDIARFSSFQSAKRAVAIALIFIKRLTRVLKRDRQMQILSKIAFMKDIINGAISPLTTGSLWKTPYAYFKTTIQYGAHEDGWGCQRLI